MFGAPKLGRFWSLASLILVANVVGELQRKRTLAASRGFLAEGRLSCLRHSVDTVWRLRTRRNRYEGAKELWLRVRQKKEFADLHELLRMIDWLISVLRPLQHSIGYMGDGFYRSKDPTNSIKVLKEKAAKENNTKKTKKNRTYTHTQNSIQITVTQINTTSSLQ